MKAGAARRNRPYAVKRNELATTGSHRSDHRTPPSAVAKPSRMMRAKSRFCIAVLGGTVPTQATRKGHSAKKRTNKNQRGGYQDREPLILPTR